MEILEKELGKKLSVKQVAILLGRDEKTIRKHYSELGGMRLGRCYMFFERRIVDAIQKRTELYCPSAEGWTETAEGICDEEASAGVGSQDEAKTRQRLEREDRHSLFG